MRITDQFNYRCALEILESKYPDQFNEILSVLNDIDSDLIENETGNNNFSRQIQERFTSMSDGW